MRKLSAFNFNTPATPEEIAATLREMRAHQHVNRDMVKEYASGGFPYVLTLGKLMGLADSRLHINTSVLARKLGVEVQHPVKDQWKGKVTP